LIDEVGVWKGYGKTTVSMAPFGIGFACDFSAALVVTKGNSLVLKVLGLLE
jgi:hypothetical protein